MANSINNICINILRDANTIRIGDSSIHAHGMNSTDVKSIGFNDSSIHAHGMNSTDTPRYCINCGQHTHNTRNCTEAKKSYGVILFKIDGIKIVSKKNDKLLEKKHGVSSDTRPVMRNLSRTGTGTLSDTAPIKKRTKLSYFMSTFVRKKKNILDYTKCEITNDIPEEKKQNIQIYTIYRSKIKFLLVRRKHSLGYLEFVRGKYAPTDLGELTHLFEQMTPDEIKLIHQGNFDSIWVHKWEDHTDIKESKEAKEVKEIKEIKEEHKVTRQYVESKHKFEFLQKNGSLNYLCQNVIPKYTIPEWGFPKGRRNYNESDLMCAQREFTEESGYRHGEYIVLKNISPIEENLVGTNKVNYRHIYFTGIPLTERTPFIDQKNNAQFNEVGDIGWFSLDEALMRIRPYHQDKIAIIYRMFNFVMQHILDYYHKKYLASKKKHDELVHKSA